VSFKHTYEGNLYWTLRGCETKGTVTVPKTAINAIMNWAGACTDPDEGPDYYNNPRAMYVALDLIYRLLDTLHHAELNIETYEQGLMHKYHIPQIKEEKEQ
jgi:hypothetical protein